MKSLKPSLLAIIVLIFFSCTTKDVEITLLCTNDIHGRVDNFPKLAAYYTSVKASNPNTFLFSGGDMFSGNPLVDNYPDKGYPIIDLMNKTGYRLNSIGNHEFDYGQDILNDRRAQAVFPFLSANVLPDSARAQLKQVEPYRIYKIDGITMAVLGLTQVGADGTPSAHPDRMRNIVFTDPVKTVEKYRFLRENNVFVGLFHTGLETDVEIANAVPELDVILGGHSHTKIDTGMLQNGVLITQAAAYLQYVGETRISIKNGKVVKRTNRLVNLNELVDEDAEVRALLDKYKKDDPLSKVIGRAANEVEGKERLGSLMTRAIVEETGVDMAFQNAGGIRIDRIPKGDVTLNTIYSLDPFNNDVVKLTMSYDEIASLLKGTLKRYELPDLYASGMSYKFEFDANSKLKSFEMFDASGKPLDKNKKYTVGMNSYIYSKYEFKHEDPGAAAGITASQTLIDYIQRIKEIE